MTKKQSLINYLPLLIFILCFLIFFPVQSQTPGIGITLTWSTNTYVPADYPGKALPTRGSAIEVVANIDSKEVNPQELNYRWFLNDHVQREKSDKGKSIFKFLVNQRAENRQSIRLEVRGEEENLLNSAYLDIGIIEPQIVIQSIIKKHQISAGQEVSFMVQPYFFNIKDVDELNYRWSLGGKEASQTDSKNPNLLVLKISQLAKSIKQDLTVWVENKNNPLQRAQTRAEITFIP